MRYAYSWSICCLYEIFCGEAGVLLAEGELGWDEWIAAAWMFDPIDPDDWSFAIGAWSQTIVDTTDELTLANSWEAGGVNVTNLWST